MGADGIQQANQQVDTLLTKLREYSMAGESEKPAILQDLADLSAEMDEGALAEYLGLLTQIQSLLDSGMSESEIQAMFPDIDVSGLMDQFAGVADYIDLIKTDLPGLYSMFNQSLPEEVLKIATDLDMTGAQARWNEFAANPGAITTEAIITGYANSEDSEAQQPKIEAFITKYTVTDETDATALSPEGVIAYVTAYAEATNGADVSGLTPENVTAMVAAYEELASGADVSALKPDEITAYISNYMEANGVDTSGLTPDGLTAFVLAYQEVTGGALTTALTPDGITAMVARYMEAEGIDLSALSPDQVEAVVTAYAEATGCDKSQLLTSFTAYITAYKEAEGVTIPQPKTRVVITGYDYLAYNELNQNPDLELEVPVRLGELDEGEFEEKLSAGQVKYWQTAWRFQWTWCPKTPLPRTRWRRWTRTARSMYSLPRRSPAQRKPWTPSGRWSMRWTSWASPRRASPLAFCRPRPWTRSMVSSTGWNPTTGRRTWAAGTNSGLASAEKRPTFPR